MRSHDIKHPPILTGYLDCISAYNSLKISDYLNSGYFNSLMIAKMLLTLLNRQFRETIIFIAITVVPGSAIANENTFESDFSDGKRSEIIARLTADQDKSEVIRLKKEFRKSFSQNPAELRPLYELYIDKIGANGILDVLEEDKCHGQGHDLGKIIFDRSHNISLSGKICQSRCTSGCFHGVLMEAATVADTAGQINSFTDRVTSLCAGDVKQRSIGTCIHGIGHSLMYLSKYNINGALNQCSELFGDQKPFEYFCATGAYMEYFLENIQPSIVLFYPCNLEERFPAACYRYRVQEEIITRKLSFKQLTASCLALRKRHRTGCFHGIGKAHIQMIFDKPALLNKACGSGSIADQKICIEGVIEKLADLDISKALQACSQLDKELVEFCRTTANNGMYNINKDFSSYFITDSTYKIPVN